MSSCISSHGEYSEHEITTTLFTCDRCGVFDEAAAMAEIDRLNDLVTRWKDAANAADNVIRATLAELHAEPDSDPVLIARKRMDEIDRLNATIQRVRDIVNDKYLDAGQMDVMLHRALEAAQVETRVTPSWEQLTTAIALEFEGCGEAWIDDSSGDRLASVAADAVLALFNDKTEQEEN